MFSVIIAGVFNTLLLSSLIILTYFQGYDYFLNGTIRFTENDVYTTIYFSIAVSAILVLIFSTKICDPIFNLILHVRKLIPREEEMLYPLFEDVHNAAVKKFNLKKMKIKLKVRDENTYNMAAVGLSTISINRKVYEGCNPQTIKALIAHELSHLYNRDSINLRAIYILTGLASVSIITCACIIVFCVAFGQGLTRGGITMLALPIIGIILLCAAIIFGIIYCVFYCFNVFIRFCNRRNEFRADKFASDLGYGKELISFFENIKDADYEMKGIKKHLFSTHPKNILRIGRLEKLMNNNLA